MTLAISDTIHLTGKDKSRRDGFLPYEDIPLEHFLEPDKQEVTEHQPPAQQEVTEQQPPAQQETKADAGLKILQDFTAQQQAIIDKYKPVYDIEREKRLQRIGKAQKFADALTVLGQVIGANAGASVPAMQLNNSAEASAIIQKMRDVYENEDKRHKLLSLSAQMKGAEMMVNEQMRRQQTDEANRTYSQRLSEQQAKEMQILQERERIANDPNSFDNQLKARKQANDDAESNARVKYYDAGSNSRYAYAESERGSGTTTKGGRQQTAYLELYDDLGKEPAYVIQNEWQARALFNKIIEANPKAADLKRFRPDQFTGETSVPKKDDIDDVISRYWKTVLQPAKVEKPGWLPGQQQQSQQEYKPAAQERRQKQTEWLTNPQNQTALDGFVTRVEQTYAGNQAAKKAAITTYLVKNAGFDIEEAKSLVEDYYKNIED